MAQDYDVALKVLLRHFPEDFVRLAFGNVNAKINLMDRELEATKLYVDGLAQVTITEETFLFHCEFFSSHDKDVPERMYNYAARIAAKYPGFGVYGVALYINKPEREKNHPNVFESRILGEIRSYYKFNVIKIWELEANEILRQQITGLLPVVSLMKYEDKETERIIRSSIQQLQQKIAKLGLRAEMFAALYLFSGLKKIRVLVNKLLKEANMLELLKKSETYQEILAEGKAEGKAEGRREAWINSVLSILHARFGALDDDGLVSQLQLLNDDRLSKLVVDTISVTSFKAFKKLLATSRRHAKINKAKN